LRELLVFRALPLDLLLDRRMTEIYRTKLNSGERVCL
jgi:hypothetical protein